MHEKGPALLFHGTRYELSAIVDDDEDEVVEITIWLDGEPIVRFSPRGALTPLKRAALEKVLDYYNLIRVLEPI